MSADEDEVAAELVTAPEYAVVSPSLSLTLTTTRGRTAPIWQLAALKS